MFQNAEEVLAYIKKNDVKFVDVRFCDLPGVMQHFNIPAASFDQESFDNARWIVPPARTGRWLRRDVPCSMARWWRCSRTAAFTSIRKGQRASSPASCTWRSCPGRRCTRCVSTAYVVPATRSARCFCARAPGSRYFRI